MNNHPIFKYLNEQDYLQFYKYEIEFRNQCCYPPIYHLTTVELYHGNPIVIDNEAQLFTDKADAWRIEHKKDIKILGPVKPIVYRIQKTEMRQIFLKALNNSDLHSLCKALKINQFKSTISIIPSSI